MLHRLFVGGVAPSVGNGGGFGICFTGCLLEELRRLLAKVVVLELASQAVCWRSCAVCWQRWGFGICFTGCLLEERLRNDWFLGGGRSLLIEGFVCGVLW